MRIRLPNKAQTAKSGGILICLLIVSTGWNLISWRIKNNQTMTSKIDSKSESARAPAADSLRVVMADGGQDPDKAFNTKLLRLILQRSGRRHNLQIYPRSFNQNNIIRALETSEDFALTDIERVNVAVMGADSTINRRLHRIPLPIAGGLLGMRVGFLHRNHLPLTKKVKSRSDLTNLILLQGVGWRDVDILDSEGLKTFSARPSELLRILDSGRAHLFLRGVGEIETEYATIRTSSEHLILDENLLIIYPFAGFFYVNKQNHRLAEALETGFKRAIADGSYEDLVHQELLTHSLRKKLRMRSRNVIYLNNYDANAAINGVDPKLWRIPWRQLTQGEIKTGAQLCHVKTLKDLC